MCIGLTCVFSLFTQGAVQEEPEAAEVAETAAAGVKGLLMAVAMRLEVAVQVIYIYIYT